MWISCVFFPPSFSLHSYISSRGWSSGREGGAYDIMHTTFIVLWSFIQQINSILIGILETNEKKLQVLDGLFVGFLNLSDLILTN